MTGKGIDNLIGLKIDVDIDVLAMLQFRDIGLGHWYALFDGLANKVGIWRYFGGQFAPARPVSHYAPGLDL